MSDENTEGHPIMFRKLTNNEILTVVKSYSNMDKIKVAKSVIRQCYGTNAYKVFIKGNSEYNDEGYSVRPVILVLDSGMQEMDPKSGTNVSYSIGCTLYSNAEYADNEPEDYTFTMTDDDELPDLYIRSDHAI